MRESEGARGREGERASLVIPICVGLGKLRRGGGFFFFFTSFPIFFSFFFFVFYLFSSIRDGLAAILGPHGTFCFYDFD